ncbi:hypothetical protein ACW5UC_25320 [Priestia aryabhattai]|uniref:hypothetical protein n=1 Tax=Priestia megaterium TaxID=1404 RepID=UPI003F97D4AE
MAKTSIKKSVSFREDVFDYAFEQADMYFGGNLSAYITYLICADKHGLARVAQTEEIAVAKEEIKENLVETKFEKNEEAENFIDQFMNL